MNYRREIEAIEIPLLTRAVLHRYGYNLEEYRPEFLTQEIHQELKERHLPTITRLQEAFLHDGKSFEKFLVRLATSRANGEGGASFFKALTMKVIPLLKTYPLVRIWQVGGAVKELNQLIRLVQKAGLADKTSIYYTSPSQRHLEDAQKKVAPCEPEKNVAFFQHNPMTDGSFNEFNVILSRNLLSQMDKAANARLLDLFHESLCSLGVLGLGRRDLFPGPSSEAKYRRLVKAEAIYQKVG